MTTALCGQAGKQSMHPQHLLMSKKGASPLSIVRKAFALQLSFAKHGMHIWQIKSSTFNMNLRVPSAMTKIIQKIGK